MCVEEREKRLEVFKPTFIADNTGWVDIWAWMDRLDDVDDSKWDEDGSVELEKPKAKNLPLGRALCRANALSCEGSVASSMRVATADQAGTTPGLSVDRIHGWQNKKELWILPLREGIQKLGCTGFRHVAEMSTMSGLRLN